MRTFAAAVMGVVCLIFIFTAASVWAAPPQASEEAYTIAVEFGTFTLHLFDVEGNELFSAPVALPRRTLALPLEGYVMEIQRDPYWYPTAKVKAYILKHEGIALPDVVKPGNPHNAMGKGKVMTRFLTPGAESLSRIHGTISPKSIGTRASSGCIRMFNEDIVALIDLIEAPVKAGARVRVVYLRFVDDDPMLALKVALAH